MKHFLKLAAVALLVLATACSEKTEQQDIKLNYESYTLPNGLKVVLHEDKSDPLVSLAIQYHVGSNREKPGKTGFAHFFEHMLFQRSENLPRNAFFQKINQMGGDFNGMTSQDGTVYFEVVPRDALEKVLWMESDRMGFFINTVTEGGLKREIDIVSNEKRQGENNPYAFVYEIAQKNLYPKGHPYSWTVIGELEDLRSATLDDVKEFYNKYYTPSNATLVLAGDFDKAEAKQLIEKYFGEIADRGKPESLKPIPVTLDSVKSYYYEDKYATAPMQFIAYPTVEANHADEAALDILSRMMGGSKKSPLYKVIVEEKKFAPSVGCYNSTQELTGEFSIDITTFKDVNLNNVYDAIQEAFARFEKDGVSEAELTSIKNKIETQVYNQLSGLMYKSLIMAQSNEFAGAPDAILANLKAYQAVTSADIMRVYEKYIKGKNYGAVAAVPVGQATLAMKNAVNVPVVYEKVEDQKKQSNEGAIVDDPYEFTKSTFDRSKEPELLANTPQVKAPAIWTAKAANGMNMQGTVYNELPLVSFSFILNNGSLNDPADKQGLTVFLGRMLNEGTASKTPEELEDALNTLGASLRFGTGSEQMVLSGNCLKKNVPAVMALVQEMLLSPRWDAKAFERVQSQLIDDVHQMSTYPSAIGSNVFKKKLFGENSPKANTPTEESYKAITMDDLKAAYDKYISPSIAKFSIVGNFTQADAESLMKPLNTVWAAKEVNQAIPADEKIEQQAKVYFVDYPGSAQALIMLGSTAMPENSPEAYPATIVNFKLGAGSSGVLFDELRLKRGYTYGAYSGFVSGNYINSFRAQSSVEAQFTQQSVELFKSIIGGWGEAFNQTTLDETRSSMQKSQSSMFETPSDILNILNSIALYNLPLDYISTNQTTLNNFTLDQAKATIAKTMDYNNMIFVIVADAKTQLPILEKSGIGKIIKVDANGNPVK